jgi:hypothetical protein
MDQELLETQALDQLPWEPRKLHQQTEMEDILSTCTQVKDYTYLYKVN